MDIPRDLAIRILDQACFQSGKDDGWWADLMESAGLYDQEKDTWPSFSDLLYALGVSEEELSLALRPRKIYHF